MRYIYTSMQDLHSLLEALVSIDSVNPSLTPEGPGEKELAQFVQDWCETHDLQTYWVEPTKGRPSIVAIAPGTGGGRSLMLNAHLDTVGTTGMEHPFEPRIQDGRLFGRGALDMKAGLAACMTAAAQARKLALRGDVILTAVADEEHGSLGTMAVLERFSADAAVLTEPSNLELHLAHRGFAVFDIETHGKASHTSQPHHGVNAIGHMGRILHAIETLDHELHARQPHPLLGHGSAQVTLIKGGQELFTTPDSCRISYERRTLPGESLGAIQEELEQLLQRAGIPDAQFRASTRLVLHREPFEVSSDEAIVQVMHSAFARHTGQLPTYRGAPYWMDAALLAGAGIPTVVFGPSGEGLHSPNEWVDLHSVQTCSSVLLHAIKMFCQ